MSSCINKQIYLELFNVYDLRKLHFFKYNILLTFREIHKINENIQAKQITTVLALSTTKHSFYKHENKEHNQRILFDYKLQLSVYNYNTSDCRKLNVLPSVNLQTTLQCRSPRTSLRTCTTHAHNTCVITHLRFTITPNYAPALPLAPFKGLLLLCRKKPKV